MKIEKPVRIAHTYTQTLHGPAHAVFPLLCPVREADWIEGWDPDVVYTASGVAENDCVFITGSGAERAIWTVTQYAPAAGVIEFIKTAPELTVARIHIRVTPHDAQSCSAEITYQHTALSAAGATFIADFSAEKYVEFMRAWEARVNHYLSSGTMLRSANG
jgi:hypothetical protein